MQFKNGSLVLAMGFLLFSLTACTTFKADGLAVIPVPADMTILGHFEEKVTVHEVLGDSGGTNLFNISAKSMENETLSIVWKKIQEMGGDGAVNVSIRYGANFLDLLANTVTLGIWAPAHLYVEGDIVKWNDGPYAAAQTGRAVQDAVTRFEEEVNADLTAYLADGKRIAKN